VKSKATPLVKYFAKAKCEMKSTHSPSRRISHCVAIFHPPVRVDLEELRLLVPEAPMETAGLAFSRGVQYPDWQG